MEFLKLSPRVLVLIFMLPPLYGWAEGEEPKAEEAKAEGGVQKPDSYQTLDAKVNGMKIKAEGHRRKIKELAEAKALQTDESAIRSMLDEMVSEAKEMKKTLKRFWVEKKRLMYSYPGKGNEVEQKYRRFEVEMVEELNSLSNIDLRLKGLLTDIEQAYVPPPEVKEIELRRKETSDQKKARRTLKEEPTPVEARPKLSY